MLCTAVTTCDHVRVGCLSRVLPESLDRSQFTPRVLAEHVAGVEALASEQAQTRPRDARLFHLERLRPRAPGDKRG